MPALRLIVLAAACLGVLSISWGQAKDTLERLKQYQERYNQWASRHTFVWEIEYSDTRNKAILARELPNRDDIRKPSSSPQMPSLRASASPSRVHPNCVW
jgi:hypothetical protein